MSEPIPTLKRVSNWPAALDQFLADHRDLPFTWGTNDCCLFTCDAIVALTGIDLAAELRRCGGAGHIAGRSGDDVLGDR